MSASPHADLHRLFAADLRRIRESRGFTPDDVYRGTKSPVEIVRAFEETALVDHPRFNDIYLRSFVKSYAQVVGLPATEVLEALEAARSGRYRGELGRKYLDAGTHEYYQEVTAPPPPVFEQPPAPKPPAPPVSTPPKKAVPRLPDLPISPLLIGAGIGGALLLLLLVWGLWSLFSRDAPDPPPPEPVAEVLEPDPEEPRFTAVPEPVTLPDTLELYMVASGGILEGIRVSIDDGPFRRRWVEVGDSLRLSLVDRIEIDAGPYLRRMTLRMQGHTVPVPTTRGTVSLSREDIRRVLEETR